MREHKYKAKRLDNGEWIEGYYWQNGCGNHFIRVIDEQNEIVLLDIEIDPNTLCEFIGYQDSNKQKLCQNDIVRFYLGNEKLCDLLIWYNNEMQCMSVIDLKWIKFNGFDYFNFNNSKFKYEDFCFMLQDPWGDYSKIEVIGNIFDNPALLELN